MAKTSIRRHHVQRLQKKWEMLNKHLKIFDDVEDRVTFGKIYSQDPFDCGNPKCNICNFTKVMKKKQIRKDLRKQEKNAKNEIYEE